MGILTRVGAALQSVFGRCAVEAGECSGVIQRQRKFDALSLAKCVVLGFLKNPQASDADLAAMAIQCGVHVSPQGVSGRQTPRLVAFLEELFRRATRVSVRADAALAPLLERFSSVDVLDSSTVSLPDSQRERFPGCGGSFGGGQAAMKLQTTWDLKGGAIACVEIEPGRSPDVASSVQHAAPRPGALRITDLGYYHLAVFARIAAVGAFFLSRMSHQTKLRTREGGPLDVSLDVSAWLSSEHSKTRGGVIDQAVLLGSHERLPVRLIAWRVPPEQANRRRQKLRASTRSKGRGEPSQFALAWCGWTVLITNLPPETATPAEAIVLYRARWQVELLFKRWKSLGLIDRLDGTSETRTMVRVWARLTAGLIAHWLCIASVWSGGIGVSLYRVFAAVRDYALLLVAALDRPADLHTALEQFCTATAHTCRTNKRKKAGTFELLNDVQRLDFRLN